MKRRRTRRLSTRLLQALDVDAHDLPAGTARRGLRRWRWTPRSRRSLC